MAVLIVAIVAIAAPLVVISAASRVEAPPIAVGASVSPGADPQEERGPKKDKALKLNGRGNGGLKGNGHSRGPITIRAISGSQLSLATDDGWTRTITVTSATVITKGGQPIEVGALRVGDHVRFSQARNADGSYAITAIAVPTPTAGGEVTAVDASSITVKGKGGETTVITVNDATVYQLGRTPASKADVKVGLKVNAQGTRSGDTFTAITVRVSLPAVAGEVSAKTADSIVIKRREGATTVIHVSDKTTFKYKGKDAGSLADIAVGDRVEAAGTLRADGSMDAVSVAGGPKKAPKAPKSSKTLAPSAAPG